MKEAFLLVHAEPEPAIVTEWNAFHAKDHVPLVLKTAGFTSAQRFRHVGPEGLPAEPPKFTTVYRASGLGVIREYLEGGQVGKMREHHEAWLAGRRVHITRETLEENYSVDGDGKAAIRAADLPTGRAAFVVRARVEPETVAAWSAWYDREHMPAVARCGFLRAGRYRVVEDSAANNRFAILYEAPSVESVIAFLAGPGVAFGKEHAEKFDGKIARERVLWALAD